MGLEARIATGTLTIIAGPGGVGKGALWVELTARLTHGQLDGDSAVFRNEYSSSPPRRMSPTWLHQDSTPPAPTSNGCGCSPCKTANTPRRDAPRHLGHVREAVESFIPAMVIIDPLNAHLSERIDGHKDASLRRALAPLTRLAGDTCAAVVGVAHTNKGYGDAVSRVLGSVGYVNAARGVLIVGNPPDIENGPERVVAMPKSTTRPLSHPSVSVSKAARSPACSPMELPAPLT